MKWLQKRLVFIYHQEQLLQPEAGSWKPVVCAVLPGLDPLSLCSGSPSLAPLSLTQLLSPGLAHTACSIFKASRSLLPGWGRPQNGISD